MTVGLMLNSEHYNSVLDPGPPADDPKVKYYSTTVYTDLLCIVIDSLSQINITNHKTRFKLKLESIMVNV